MNTVKKQIEIVTTLSTEIGIKFTKNKCAFLFIKIYFPLNINHLTTQPVADGDIQKYLNIVPIIWSSELSNFNCAQ